MDAKPPLGMSGYSFGCRTEAAVKATGAVHSYGKGIRSEQWQAHMPELRGAARFQTSWNEAVASVLELSKHSRSASLVMKV